MNRKLKFLLPTFILVVLLGLQVGFKTAFGQVTAPVKSDRAFVFSNYFTPATKVNIPPNDKGYVQRWLILDPVKKNITSNNLFTDSFVKTTLSDNNFSNDYAMIPENGKMEKIEDQELQWRAFDTKTYNFRLYRYAEGIEKPQNGVIFWVVTVINCPEEIKDVRLSAGCNSAGMFWVNGEEAVMLSGNRDLVVDNVTSKRLTLKKGKNVIRGAIVNGQGIIDFCVRFLDEDFQPVKNFTISYE